MSTTRFVIPLFLLAVVASGRCEVQAKTPLQTQRQLVTYFQNSIAQRSVVGAQVYIGRVGSSDTWPISLGTLGPGQPEPVTNETVFCIGSCSKPLASAVVFTLLDENLLQLDMPAAKLLPELAAPRLSTGQATRSPMLREILTHRSGIYSQNNRPNQAQINAIRDFSQTLEQSVLTIVRQPLSSAPGTRYAYSGAGYCVLGRLAEVATESSFESLLQERLCEPLKMKSTTYFPGRREVLKIAEGGGPVRPHALGSNHRFPLIGGSIYSNVIDLSHFASMVLSEGRFDEQVVLSPRAHEVFVSTAGTDNDYGYGWILTKRGNRVIAVSHNGSLPPYQAAIHIDLRSRTYKIVLWTLANPGNAAVTKNIRGQVTQLLNGQQSG